MFIHVSTFFYQFADNNPARRMEDSVEMITEWPIKKNDDSKELNVSTSVSTSGKHQWSPQRTTTATQLCNLLDEFVGSGIHS